MGKRTVINRSRLPAHFPTHRHTPDFWEALGRVVATFSFLEEVLGKAIFALTATRRYNTRSEVNDAYDEWLRTLERALTDALGGLISEYDKSLRNYHQPTIINIDKLIKKLRMAAVYRNVVCHGSWHHPEEDGASVPFFINKKKEVFEGSLNAEFLRNLQGDTVELICDVIDSVTEMGFQFPGSDGPGTPVWSRN